jgi:hypothetical protein
MEQTECSEMSAYEIQTLGNYPEGSIQLNNHIHTNCKKDQNTSAYHFVNGTSVVNERNDKYFLIIYPVIQN